MRNSLRAAFAPVETVCPRCEAPPAALAVPPRFRLQLAAQRLTGAPSVAVGLLACRRFGERFAHVERGPRLVVAYHGCRRSFAEELARGRVTLAEWAASEREYDWIGRGVYFWEDAPGRAWQWARQRFPREPAVVGAVITLGECLDLGDTEFMPALEEMYTTLVRQYAEADPPVPMPRNEPMPARPGRPPDRDLKLRKLDRLVIDHLVESLAMIGTKVQTVRAPFEEGDDAYPGAKIRTLTHVQIAVRDKSCIHPQLWLVPERRQQ